MSNQPETSSQAPKLRFPEFQNENKWHLQAVGDLLTKVAKPVKLKPDVFYQEIGIRSHGKGIFHKKPVTGKSIGKKRVFWIEENVFVVNIVFAWELAIASTTEAEKGMIASHRFPMYEGKKGKANIRYLKYFFLTQKGKVLLTIASPGGAGRNKTLGKKEFEKLEFSIPTSVDEQQKIANCLSSLDDLITSHSQKLNKLKDHKKGLMQQLFPTEGESTPKLRFPEFRDLDKWGKTTIGEIGSFYYGKSAPKWSLEEEAPTSCVRYGELYSTFETVINKTYSRTTIDPNKLRFSKGGEILVPRVGEKPEEFGRNCCYLPLKNIAIGEMISVFETAQNALFYTYYFKYMYQQFAKVVEGQNVKNLYYAVLEPLTIYRPSLDEQKEIASCLSSIDDSIIDQTKKIELLKDHKKGLMQQLFPSIEEVD